MQPSRPTGFVSDRPSHDPLRRPRSKIGRLARTVAGLAVVLAIVSLSDCPALRAGNAPTTSSDDEARGVDSSGLIGESRERLRKLQAEIIRLGDQGLRALDAAVRPQDELINQQITVKSAEANYEMAKLSREVAEIAVLEYTEGIYKQEEATLEGEAMLARNDFDRAGDRVELVKDQLAKVKQASKGSAQDLAHEYTLEDRIVELNLREPRTRLESEKTQSKLDLFRRFARSKRVKELQSEVEELRSDKLAKQAGWEREKSKLKKLQEAAKRHDGEIRLQRALTLLGRAVAIAEQLNNRLDQAEKGPDLTEKIKKEIADTTNQLQALVEEAQAEEAAARWTKLKPTVHGAAVRYPSPDLK